MSHVKAGGSAKNLKDSPGQRLGVKRSDGQSVKAGQIIVRQIGSTKQAGPGTFLSRDFTIHASKDGVVQFKRVKKSSYSGKSSSRTLVVVE